MESFLFVNMSIYNYEFLPYCFYWVKKVIVCCISMFIHFCGSAVCLGFSFLSFSFRLFFFFWHSASLWNPGWSGIPYVDQASLESTGICICLLMLGLRVRATTIGGFCLLVFIFTSWPTTPLIPRQCLIQVLIRPDLLSFWDWTPSEWYSQSCLFTSKCFHFSYFFGMVLL